MSSDDDAKPDDPRAQIAEFLTWRNEQQSMSKDAPQPEDPTKSRWFSVRDLSAILYAAITAALVVATGWYAQAQSITILAERQTVVRATLADHAQRMNAMDRDREAMKTATAANQQLMISSTVALTEQLKAIEARLARIERRLDK